VNKTSPAAEITAVGEPDRSFQEIAAAIEQNKIAYA
jgi:hypothetical protein